MTRTRITLVGAFLAFVFLAIAAPTVTYAATSNPLDTFQPTSSDMTTWVLKAIFGDWKGNAQVPMLGAAMRKFNIFCLAFGTMMFTYTAVVGTLNTAEDGELLGKKWSSQYVPLRFVLGTSLLVPLSTGYSTIQHAVLYLALAGGGAASQVWGVAIDDFAGSSAAAVQQSPEYRSKVQLLMRDILNAEICTYVNQTQRSTSVDPAPFGYTANAPVDQVLGDEEQGDAKFYSSTMTWGALPDNTGVITSGMSRTACGSAKTSVWRDSGDASFNIAPASRASVIGDYQNASLGTTASAVAEMNAKGHAYVLGQQQGISAAAADLRAFAHKMAAFTSGALKPTQAQQVAAIQAAADHYIQVTQPSINTAASGFSSQMTAFTTASKDAGWMMAGSSFFQMAQIRSAASKTMAQVPEFTKGDSSNEGTVQSVVDANVSTDIEAMQSSVNKNFQGDTSSVMNIGTKLAYSLGKYVSVDPSNSTHALVQIKDNGDRIIVATEAVAVATAGLATGAMAVGNTAPGKVVDFFTGAKSTLMEIIHMAMPAIYAAVISCLGVGITMAFVVPMLPFSTTIGSIVGWLMAVFSAVVAAPIWLAGHLHPEGDDIAGKGIGGYMILLETVTRPLFIVFGLIGSFVIMDPIIKLVALLYRANMNALQGDSTTGIVSVIVLAILYCTITMQTVRSTMTLIYVLSENAYRWIGGAHAGMEQAREFTQGVESGSSQATSGIQGAAAAGGAARRAHVQARAEREQRNQRDE